MKPAQEVRSASFILRQYEDGRVELENTATGEVWPVDVEELDILMVETWVESAHDLVPHCAACDDAACDAGLLPPGAEAAFVDEAGPAAQHHRRWWEAKMAAFCRGALSWLGLAT